MVILLLIFDELSMRNTQNFNSSTSPVTFAIVYFVKIAIYVYVL